MTTFGERTSFLQYIIYIYMRAYDSMLKVSPCILQKVYLNYNIPRKFHLFHD